jgi:hypothetical protein
MNQDLEDKTLSELHDIIITLKTKHYIEGVSAAERTRWVRAKYLFEKKLQKLPCSTGNTCDYNIVING